MGAPRYMGSPAAIGVAVGDAQRQYPGGASGFGKRGEEFGLTAASSWRKGLVAVSYHAARRWFPESFLHPARSIVERGEGDPFYVTLALDAFDLGPRTLYQYSPDPSKGSAAEKE